MSHIIWTFSPSSQPYLQRCITAASLKETDNKWTQIFGRQNEKLLNKSVKPDEEIAAEVIEIAASPEKQEKNDLCVSYEDFFDSIENEIRLDIIAKECTKNSDLILQMAQRLSANTVEKLFNLILTSKNIEDDFLTAIIHKFLPAYIKLQYSWLCIDLLTKTSETYPELYQELLKILLDDTEIPNQVLNNFITTFNDVKNTKFMKNLVNIQLSPESFVHNILTIYSAYKDCTKTERIQDFIRTNLVKNSKRCNTDRNYGRLFLSYLQTEKSLERAVNVKQLEECLEIHASPFKRPCVILLKEFVNE